ncbi:uncharacterized protein At5g41620-like [Macadamia integrifolia]|uniref:uncharacterized protein At5g41620-like n=1 Tax=Macadamia integrifolia TaxID=60698 RepID=UPI001C530F77|nr:uncharacterized protein At5g41620-like [Macadamia integrifolia]
MEREEKGGDGAAEKQEFLGIKLRRGILVGKRGCPCTPVPTWKLGGAQDTTIKDPLTLPPTVSARKLAANLWELHHLPLSEMSKGGLKLRHHKNKGLEFPTHLADPSHSPPPAQPASASSLKRHVAASLLQHHQSIERNSRALQPLSPASYGSSLELAAYNPAVTPTSSLELKGRPGEAGYSLKTSTELLKVLNRIWGLEEQHTSNIALVKALKIELDHARMRIRELLQEQRADRQEIDDLRKQVAEGKVVRKSKEQDRIKVAVQSVRDELEDEKKLRKRSESLHRKLARELSEVKSAFSKALKELERERKARALLENLCDEFARGIEDYDQEVRTLKHKSDKDFGGRNDPDRLVLHISEAWLDERMQMKLAEAHCDLTEKNTMVDKLSSEIETFLQAKRSGSSKSSDVLPKDHKESYLRRHSLESVHLNEAVSAPKDAEDEKDSIGSDSQCFELNKSTIKDKETNDWSRSNFEETGEDNREEMKSNPIKKKPSSRERIEGHDPSSLQVQFEQIARAVASNGKTQVIDREQGKVGEDANPIETSISQKFENYEATQEDSRERKCKRDVNYGSNLNHVIGDLIKSESLVEGGKFHLENNCREDSCGRTSWRGHASPIRQWVSRFTSPDIDVAESSSKGPRVSKESTLKAKLLEARLEGQRSRFRYSKGSS